MNGCLKKLVLSLILVAGLLPVITVPVFALEVSGVLTDTAIGLSYVLDNSRGAGNWTASGETLTGTATGYTSLWGRSVTATLTITNNKGSAATLSFAYDASNINGGTFTIGGTEKTGKGSYSIELAAGGTLKVAVKSPSGKNNTGTVVLSAVSLAVAGAKTTITFLVPSGTGSYTVNSGTDGAMVSVTETTAVEKDQTDTFTMTAAKGTGFKFMGWYDVTNGKYLSYEETFSASFTSNISIQPVFVSDTTPIFQVGTQKFTDLNAADAYAVSSGEQKIVLVSDGSLEAKAYSISANKILLLPFDSAYTCYTTSAAIIGESHSAPYAYKTLTMPSGSSITVNGAISLSSQLSACGQNIDSWNGTPTGPHGRIHMENGSEITLQSGSNLYAYGYISGDGTVTAKSGSKVYESFQIRSWRGGSATVKMPEGIGDIFSGIFGGEMVKLLPVYTDNKVFPVNQYYVQNIEASLTLEDGAQEIVQAAANAAGQTPTTNGDFMGKNGLFQLSSGSKVTKRYDVETDRLIVDIEGDTSFKSFQLSFSIAGGSMDMNTASFVLPINSNMTINILSGKTTLSQDAALFPGAELNIAEGAEFELASGKNIYVYDRDQWGNYAAAGLQLVPVKCTATRNETDTKKYPTPVRTAENLKDAVVDVNGTVTINGLAYTTAADTDAETDGAEIISSKGTGQIVFETAPSTAENLTTSQVEIVNSDPTKVDIKITAAKLKNGDGSFVETASNGTATYNYKNGFWHIGSCESNAETDAAVPPTCTETGLTEGSHCSVCNTVLVAQEVVAALGHSRTCGHTVAVIGEVCYTSLDDAFAAVTAGQTITMVQNSVATEVFVKSANAGWFLLRENEGKYTYENFNLLMTYWYVETYFDVDTAWIGFGASFKGNQDAFAAVDDFGFLVNGTEVWASKYGEAKPAYGATITVNDTRPSCAVTTTLNENTVRALIKVDGVTCQSEAVTFKVSDKLKAYPTNKDGSTTAAKLADIWAGKP